DKRERVFVCILGINIDRQYRTKDLLTHGDGGWILGDDDGGFYEIAFRLIRSAADDNLIFRILSRLFDVAGNLVKRAFVNYRVDEVSEIFNTTHAETLDIRYQPLFDFVPKVGRNIRT